ncbi:MAG: hypothetical protein ACUVX8_19070, partial [Candidatus Zipacnadales bacterium]
MRSEEKVPSVTPDKPATYDCKLQAWPYEKCLTLILKNFGPLEPDPKRLNKQLYSLNHARLV